MLTAEDNRIETPAGPKHVYRIVERCFEELVAPTEETFLAAAGRDDPRRRDDPAGRNPRPLHRWSDRVPLALRGEFGRRASPRLLARSTGRPQPPSLQPFLKLFFDIRTAPRSPTMRRSSSSAERPETESRRSRFCLDPAFART